MDDHTSLPGPVTGAGAPAATGRTAMAREPGIGMRAPGAGAAGVPGEAAGEVPEPVYTAVEDWVTGYFLPMFRRTLGGEFRWCAWWWQHGEAISRLSSLWHAWEVLRHQPGTGIGIWYRDHLDHQLPILLGARGPFYQCGETAHREPHEATAVPAPEDWWDTTDDDDPATGAAAGAGEPGGSAGR